MPDCIFWHQMSCEKVIDQTTIIIKHVSFDNLFFFYYKMILELIKAFSEKLTAIVTTDNSTLFNKTPGAFILLFSTQLL